MCSLYKGSQAIAGLAKNTIVTGFNIFDFKWSDKKLNDISWLESSTFSWQSGDVYTTAYNKLVEEYATGTEEIEGDITFKRSANGFKIADASQESAILSKYNTDGIAWYYILDTTNKRFKLPRTKFGFEGLRTNVGDDITESLPNITGYWEASASWNQQYAITKTSGLVKSYSNQSNSSLAGGDWKGSSTTRVNFDASNSSSTYQDNAPVQERATQMYLYFYVGEYAQTAIEQTAGLNAELFNNKADVTTVDTLSTTINERIYLKTAYVNGNSGYNIWSNGYCEQWGLGTGDMTSGFTISLPKTMANTNYAIEVSYLLSSKDQNTRWPLAANNRQVKAFTVYSNVYTGSGIMWKVSGYLAAGQY